MSGGAGISGGGKVIANAAMSLDGFIADTDDQVGPLFDWYGNGTIKVTGTDPARVFSISAATASYVLPIWENIGAMVVGRRLFDLIDGWNGIPPFGEAIFVVTHRVPQEWVKAHPLAHFTFVTDGIASAIARAKAFAGDRHVALAAGNLTGQAIAAGLVDEISVALAPAVFGTGRRFFGDYEGNPVLLDDPVVVKGDRVTHLHYRIRKEAH
ncbi:MAG TPA: dihydrofolate reductase family protein [Streptosporangiaceae bacterium]|nr:dihydrofolate reductase family protein [Streptosporangiaceae bacterium]